MTKRKLFSSRNFSDKLPPMHLACSADDLRPNMNCIHIEDGIATATNGYVLVRYDLRELLEENVLEAMNGKLIHRNAWKLMCSMSALFVNLDNITNKIYLNHFQHITDCRLHIPFVDDKFPNFHAVTADVFSGEFTEAKVRISMNMKQLLIIDRILSHDVGNSNGHQLRFWFSQNNKANVITIGENDNAVAMIMPIMWGTEFESSERANIKRFMKPNP